MQKILYIPIDTTIDSLVECEKLIKRGDTLTVTIKVFVNGVLADLTGQSIDLILKKADNTLIESTITAVTNGVITATLKQQATLVQGLVSGEIQIYTTNTLTSTNTFTFNVDASLADDVLEISKDDVQVLADLRNLINDGQVTIAKYENSILAIGNSIGAIEALANIKLYIDTNLPALESENASATVNVVNLKIENNKAPTLITNLTTQNTNAISNISTLTTKNADAVTNKTNLDAINATATTTKNDLSTINTTALATKSALDASNSTATTTKTNIDSENVRAEANITAMQSFGDVTALSTDVTALKTEVQNARNGEVNLDARLDKSDLVVAGHTTQLSELTNDATRTTTSKTVTGAINELNSGKVNKSQIVQSLAVTENGYIIDAKVIADALTPKTYTVGYNGNYFAYADAENDNITVEVVNGRVTLNGFCKIIANSTGTQIIANSTYFTPKKGYIRLVVPCTTIANNDGGNIPIVIGNGAISLAIPAVTGLKFPINASYLI